MKTFLKTGRIICNFVVFISACYIYYFIKQTKRHEAPQFSQSTETFSQQHHPDIKSRWPDMDEMQLKPLYDFLKTHDINEPTKTNLNRLAQLTKPSSTVRYSLARKALAILNQEDPPSVEQQSMIEEADLLVHKEKLSFMEERDFESKFEITLLNLSKAEALKKQQESHRGHLRLNLARPQAQSYINKNNLSGKISDFILDLEKTESEYGFEKVIIARHALSILCQPQDLDQAQEEMLSEAARLIDKPETSMMDATNFGSKYELMFLQAKEDEIMHRHKKEGSKEAPTSDRPEESWTPDSN